MIHHVSLAARNPEHVAKVLAELTGGTYGRFLGPCPGAYNVMLEDAHGSAIEVYPDGTVARPGEEDAPGSFALTRTPDYSPFHILLSVQADRETIERIGAREGWRVRHFWRGPEGKGFQLTEFWIENRFLLELMTPEGVAGYARFETLAVQDAMRPTFEAHWGHMPGLPVLA